MQRYNFTPRDWQKEQLEKFQGIEHSSTWVTVAGTGTGKTLATGLMINEAVIPKYNNPVVLVAAPLSEVKEGWIKTLDAPRGEDEDHTAPCFYLPATDDLIDFDDTYTVYATTYQGVAKSDSLIYTLQKSKRPIILVLDEIHRLEESVEDGATSSAWTEGVNNLFENLNIVQTFCLTATPWREGKNVRLPYINYDDNNLVIHNFKWDYGDELTLGDSSGVIRAGFRSFNGRCIRNAKDAKMELDTDKMEQYDPLKNNKQFGLRPFVDVKTDLSLSNKSYIKAMISEAVADLKSARRNHKHAKGLVVCNNIESAKVIETYMKSIGINPLMIHSKSNDVRDKLKKMRTSSDVDWAISVALITEGVDVPPAKILVDLSENLTLREIIQRWGRVLRRSRLTGNMDAKIYFIGHAMLKYVANHLREQIRKATESKKPSKRTGNEPNDSFVFYTDHDGSANGGSAEGKDYDEKVAHLADWMFRDNYGDMESYPLCLKHAELCLSKGLLPPEYDPNKDYREEFVVASEDRPLSARDKKAKQISKNTELVSEIARTDSNFIEIVFNEGIGPAVTAVNSRIKYQLVSNGYTPNTKQYRDARSLIIANWARSLGIEVENA